MITRKKKQQKIKISNFEKYWIFLKGFCQFIHFDVFFFIKKKRRKSSEIRENVEDFETLVLHCLCFDSDNFWSSEKLVIWTSYFLVPTGYCKYWLLPFNIYQWQTSICLFSVVITLNFCIFSILKSFEAELSYCWIPTGYWYWLLY